MGYMGFGMRKEVYKRKAKKPFNKLKEIYGDQAAKPNQKSKTGKLTRDEVLNKSRFKSIHDFKIFQIIKVLIMLLLLSLGIYYGFLKNLIYNFQLNNIKSNLIESFNSDHEWLLNRKNSLNIYPYFTIDSTSELSMTFGKSFRRWDYYDSGKPTYYNLNLNDSAFIGLKHIDGKLNIIKEDTSIALLGQWKVNINESGYIGDFRKKIKALNINPKLINDIQLKLRKNSISSLKIEKEESILKVAGTREFGNFYYLNTNKEYKNGTAYIKIKDRFYLKREKNWK